jgi:hypothetical protein
VRQFKESKYLEVYETAPIAIEGIVYYSPQANLQRYLSHIAKVFIDVNVKLDISDEIQAKFA